MSTKYDKLEEIGSGTFGRAWLVRRKDSGKKYVIKEIQVSKLSQKEKNQTLVEVEALARCKHVNVIRYKEAFFDAGVLSIAMEYGDGGDLKKRIKEAKGEHFPEDVVLEWFVQIVFAMKYIHGLHILHRDLKTQNIFIAGKNILKVGDFGIARIMQDTCEQASTAIGTPIYLSPEICRQKPYDSKSDMWSVGCVLYELCALTPPFEAPDISTLVIKIINGSYSPIPSKYSSLLDDVVRALLHSQPESRPSAAQLLAIPALQTAVSVYINRMKALRDAVAQSPAANRVKKEQKKTVKNSEKKPTPVPVDANKENVYSSGDKKARAVRRVSWSTPKSSPLVPSNRIVNSDDTINQASHDRGCKSPVPTPKISLYREALRRWKESERSQQCRNRMNILRKSPGSPVPHRIHTPHSKVASHKLNPHRRKSTSPLVALESRVVHDDRTYTVRKSLTSLCNDAANDAKLKASPEGEITPHPGSFASFLVVCRYLYESCQPTSLEDTIARTENLRHFLEDRMGAHEFLRDYTTVREALARGREFEQVEGLVRGSFHEYFPLVMQLIQMECCSKL